MANNSGYRLQALLQIREREEETAKQAFADAMNYLRAQEKKLQELEQELARMAEARKARREEHTRKLASGEMKITDQSAAFRYIDRLKKREQEQQGLINAQQEHVDRTEEKLRLAQEGLVKATQNLKALVKHKEKWKDERKRARQQKEEDLLDEIAQTIFQQKQRGP